MAYDLFLQVLKYKGCETLSGISSKSKKFPFMVQYHQALVVASGDVTI